MKQKKAGRISQRQREKRRYPFNESTKLIELVDKKHYGDVVKLTERLKPYLTDGVKGPFSLTILTRHFSMRRCAEKDTGGSEK